MLNICPNELETLDLYKTLHMNVYRGFIYNYQSLDTAKVSFSKWLEEQISVSVWRNINPVSHQAMQSGRENLAA